jgi:Holliday junction resolvase RusA-like endonuclease
MLQSASLDAANGIIWKDDAQVVDATVSKRYAEQPSLRIEVREFRSTD